MNEPRTQLVIKPMRMTAKKKAVLLALADLGANFLEWGTPPYALSALADYMEADLSNLAKTLKALERDGLVVREVAEATCWNAIAQAHMPRRCVCYWLAESMSKDKADAEEWRAGSEDRAERAFDRMFSRSPTDAIDAPSRVLPA